ncbi:hypothetical protein Mal52_01560 [Symmachiella dynata]|uniref:Uncharacterized protein n=1 Tax=Symmachiella dynata TaxID=2527995 RepID=A0A517ZGU1_9PLAN|nr:hypothetical protein [Symmachiella dynata]QDU41703.1 hypothetical protein Mal52_01560 [Symmachiella dynata]
MMYRVFAILLTLAVPLQGVAVPHCHGESAAEQPADHHQAPHFHFGHGHHHDDSTAADPNGSEAPSPAEEHDDDAVYVTSDLTVGLMQDRALTLDASSLALTVADDSLAIQCACFDCLAAPPDYGVEHIFLATAALRL